MEEPITTNDSLPWLLEFENPGVRYLALRDLFDLAPDDKKMKTARKSAHKDLPIAHVLSKMDDEVIGSSLYRLHHEIQINRLGNDFAGATRCVCK